MSNASDFIIENGILKQYVGPGGDVVIPDGVTEIAHFTVGFRETKSITFPDSLTSITSSCISFGMKKVIFSERVTTCDYNLFARYCTVEYIGSTGSEKVQNEKGPRIVCSDELLNVLWDGLDAGKKRKICLFQMQRQGITGEKMAPVVKSYSTKNKKILLDAIIEADDPAAMSTWLNLGKKPTLNAIDDYLEKSQGKQNLMPFLLDHKAKNFSADYIEQNECAKIEKELGLKELSVADWRKIYTFKLENDTAIISKYKGDEKVVFIPARIGKFNVVLENNVFSKNKTLEQVTLMPHVNSIPPYCFSGCTNLKVVLVPESVKIIGSGAFSDCCALKQINLPSGLTEIWGNAFSGCKNLTDVTIPEGVKTIAPGSFYDCRALKQINLPSGLTEIQEAAFCGCENLAEVVIPNGVKKIGDDAFRDCSALERITVSKRTKLGKGVFKYCEKLVDPQGFTIVNSILFDSRSQEEEIHIPPGVTRISSHAFNSNHTKHIVVSNSIKTIETEAFRTDNLEAVMIPATVKTICAKAFWCGRNIPRKLVIYAPSGSAAEAFAVKNNIPFVAE